MLAMTYRVKLLRLTAYSSLDDDERLKGSASTIIKKTRRILVSNTTKVCRIASWVYRALIAADISIPVVNIGRRFLFPPYLQNGTKIKRSVNLRKSRH